MNTFFGHRCPLTFVCGFELFEFEFDGDEPVQIAMVEEEVEVMVLAVHPDALVASKKGEPDAEFEEEAEDRGIAKDKVGCELFLAAQGGQFLLDKSLHGHTFALRTPQTPQITVTA